MKSWWPLWQTNRESLSSPCTPLISQSHTKKLFCSSSFPQNLNSYEMHSDWEPVCPGMHKDSFRQPCNERVFSLKLACEGGKNAIKGKKSNSLWWLLPSLSFSLSLSLSLLLSLSITLSLFLSHTLNMKYIHIWIGEKGTTQTWH